MLRRECIFNWFLDCRELWAPLDKANWQRVVSFYLHCHFRCLFSSVFCLVWSRWMHVSSVLRCSVSVHLQYFDEVRMCHVKNVTENFVEYVHVNSAIWQNSVRKSIESQVQCWTKIKHENMFCLSDTWFTLRIKKTKIGCWYYNNSHADTLTWH